MTPKPRALILDLDDTILNSGYPDVSFRRVIRRSLCDRRITRSRLIPTLGSCNHYG